MQITTPVKMGSVTIPCLALLLATPSVWAMDLSSGELSANLDVTVSVGGTYRLNDPAADQIGLANGGTAYSVNADDGNLNYDKGWVSVPVLLSADLQMNYRNSGAFFRANAFYDTINEDEDRERTPLTSAAMDRVGSRFDMLDAYVWHNFEIGGNPVNFRVGRQVLNWGESTFIQNGISAINPVDVSKLRLPGSELRDAFLPVWMASASIDVSDNVTIEAFYQLKYKEIIIDPPGTFFSTNDFVGRGGSQVYLGFGALSDLSPLGAIPRGEDVKPSDSGQFGLASRIYAPGLNGTEFGLFFLNTHSRLPVLSARTPTVPINTDLTGPLTMVFMQAGLPAASAQAQAAQLWGLLTIYQKFQINPALLTPTELAILQNPASQATLGSPQTTAAVDGAKQIALLTSAATGRYLVEYPEDIKLVGASLNTDIGSTGISLQGEISYKWDQPLQVDDVELLFAALSAVNPAFGQITQLDDMLGQLGAYVKGWREEEVWQAQATATKVFGPMLGADQAVFVVEVGMTYVPGLPDKDLLRFDAPGTFVSGDPLAQQIGLSPALEPAGAFADKLSYGYRAVFKLDYLNAVFSTNLSPILQFSHDVKGTTPSPILNFVEDRKSVTLALQATYQESWSANISYANYFGGGRFNQIHDRDFVSVTLKYSF